jgi:hypothetical protein
MSNSEHSFEFTNPEDFNEKTSAIMTDAWGQVEKSSKFFAQVLKANGPDSFSATVVVFNCNKEISAIVTSRPVNGKEDLYQALCEMLFLPIAIRSQLFIVLTDTTIRDPDSGEKKYDAMNMAFVSPDFCFIYTLPYQMDLENNVTFDHKSSSMVSIIKSDDDSSLNSSGDMVELFYIFSHVDNQGPFHVDDVLAFFDDNQMIYEILNKDNLKKRETSFLVKG